MMCTAYFCIYITFILYCVTVQLYVPLQIAPRGQIQCFEFENWQTLILILK